jgi:TRAP-type mannitol/chloroaromatic compound transport system substrate-binding protein
MKRRKLMGMGAGAVAAGTVGLVHAPYVMAQPKVRWRMPTTWTPALNVMLGSAQRLASLVNELSGGRFQIEVFPAGQIAPSLGVFDAASRVLDKR